MKKIYQYLLLSGLLFANAFVYGQAVTLNVPTVRQERTQWCWAANSRCVLKYYGIDLTQCTIAEYARSLNPSRFGSTNCCSSSGSCNQPNFTEGDSGIEGILKHFGALKPLVQTTFIPIDQIQSEFAANRPFIIAIYWNAGGGHVVVACGYNPTSKGLTIMDPWQNNGISTIKYGGSKAIATVNGAGKWAETITLTETPLGVANVKNGDNKIGIFPNPTDNGDLTIQSYEKIKSIKIFNNIGQLVTTYDGISAETVPVHISASGLYVIQTITADHISNNKVLVK